VHQQNSNQSSGEDKIAVIDCASEQIVAKYDAGTDPEQFVVNRDGTRLYIANEDAGTASVTDVKQNRVIASMPVGRTRRSRFKPGWPLGVRNVGKQHHGCSA